MLKESNGVLVQGRLPRRVIRRIALLFTEGTLSYAARGAPEHHLHREVGETDRRFKRVYGR